MRVIGKFSAPQKAYRFSVLLLKRGIENHIEQVNEESYVWVENEDQLDLSRSLFLEFEQGKEDLYTDILPPSPPPPKKRPPLPKTKVIKLHHVAFVTKIMILLCIAVFALTGLQQASSQNGIPSIMQWLLFEIPVTHPYWEGIYNSFVAHRFFEAPMFVQIREGEVWRLITPIFLHANFLHIAFNMLWLWSLGKPVEQRLGIVRYLILMAMVAFCSNVAQYLMSGPLFMGYSGVIAGLAGFIYIRQKEAPWEGYPIHPSTFIFLAIFIIGLAVLQGLAFIAAVLGWGTFNISVANTAHIVGALAGMALAKMRWFQ